MQHALLFLLILLWGCQSPGPGSGRAEEQPNILFLFADDQTYQALHALGNEEIITPNLDRLVRNGTSFTHAYNMGAWNGAVCLASRAMLISGRSVWRANEFRQYWGQGDSIDLSWGKLMEKAGYDTYMTGKWHVDAPADEVFQKAVHIRPGMPGDTEAGYNRPLNESDQTWTPWDTTFGGFWEGGTHWSEVLREDALSFIQKASQKEDPFFMYLAFNAPHDPRQSPKECVEKYPLEDVSVPDNYLPEYPYNEAMGAGRQLRDEGLAPFPRTPYALKVHKQEYYAIITHMDQQIGQILDALEASGKMDQTYIFFTADHGLAVGQHGLMGKQNMYDHSIRVPFVMAGPGIPTGKKVTADVYLQDVMATSLELAGAEKPSYVEFHSLLDLARGERRDSYYDAIYGGYRHLQRMIRKDGFKLIVYPEAQVVRLFDLEKDPKEMRDLAGDPAFAGKVRSLFEELMQLQKELDDELDLEPLFSKVIALEN